jgi:hypothetical protein
MNIDDLEKAVSHLDAMGPASRENPTIVKTVEKLRKQLLKRGKKEIFDDTMLESLVDLIEIHGLSQKQAFKDVGQMKGLSKSRAKKLWFETQKHDPEKIENLRLSHAYRLVMDFLIWMKGDQAEAFSSPATLIRLKNKEPELWDWAAEVVLLDVKDIKHRDFKPNYKKPVEVLEKDLLSLQKEIVSSD